jgi:hypothetical protein
MGAMVAWVLWVVALSFSLLASCGWSSTNLALADRGARAFDRAVLEDRLKATLEARRSVVERRFPQAEALYARLARRSQAEAATWRSTARPGGSALLLAPVRSI